MARPPRASDGYEDVPLSALLPAARRAYVESVARAQVRVGCADLSRTGSAILSTMHWSGASLDAVIRWLGTSKQAASQAVDRLVVRGYLERIEDPDDRRRVRLVLTDRGRIAGSAARESIERLDRSLVRRVGADRVRQARAVLVALVELGPSAGGA